MRAQGLRVELGDGSFRLKKAFETADKLALRIALLGEDEAAQGMVTVKEFRTGEQRKVGQGELYNLLSMNI